MAAESRRQLWLLGALSVALIGVLWWRLSPEPLAAPVATSRPAQAPGARRGNAAASGAAVEAVHLAALTASRTKPEEGARDPFRFRTPASSPRPVAPVTAPGADAQGSSAMAPAPPAGPPPMLLKFIGILK